ALRPVYASALNLLAARTFDSRPDGLLAEQAIWPLPRPRLVAYPVRLPLLAKSMKLRVGLIGLGEAWETRHRPALRTLQDRYEVKAVCDQVAHRAEQAAREFGASPVDGFRAVCSR